MSEQEIENEQLHQALAEKDADIQIIVESTMKTLQAVGLTPQAIKEGNVMKSIKRSLPEILGDITMDPMGLQMRFAHLKNLVPLLTKYEHLIPETE